MIISTKTYISYSFMANFVNLFKSFFLEARIILLTKQLAKDKISLKRYFKFFYPSLEKNEDSEFICIGCKLCQEVCPTLAINLEFPKLVNFPVSLKVGELPSHFYLDSDSCLQCGVCNKVCPVGAFKLEDREIFNPIIDLVAFQGSEGKSHPS